MSEPIKGCPQPDAPELVMRADGYHYRTEDEMTVDPTTRTYEQEHAIKEGHRNKAEDDYFNARPQVDVKANRVYFKGGFDRGWDAAKNDAPADRDVMRQAPATVLPDGSAFFTGSFPLPKDHWLYAPRCSEWDDARDTTADTPHQILTHEVRDSVVAAVRYAVRGATSCGAEKDFDPDAIVQNAVYALCGPYGGCTLAASPTLPAEQPNDTADQGELTPKESRLFTIIAQAYQILGALDAPAHILDVLSDPLGASDEQVEAMLPYAPAEQQGEHAPIIYKRSEFTKNWTTFNVRSEHADAAEARLKGSNVLATLRAKVEALPASEDGGTYEKAPEDFKRDVLAEIDKLGGGV